MLVDVWIDLTDPASYLGLHAFRQALAGFEGADETITNILPYFSSAPPAPEFSTGKGNGSLTGENVGLQPAGNDGFQPAGNGGNDARREALSDIGLDRGIGFKWDAITNSDTTSAQIMIAFARTVDEENASTFGGETTQLKVAEALLRARFEMGLNLADPDVLIGIGQDFKIPAEQTKSALHDVVLADEVQNSFALALHLGIGSVPTFLFDEHLVVEGVHSKEEFQNILAAAAAVARED